MMQTVDCQSNPGHSYQIYIPENSPYGEKIPLLLVIDPHGDGESGVDFFKQSATVFGMAVASSNLIQNGNLHFLREISELIDDVKGRFPIGESIFLAGFSGGARMALSFAGFRQVDGVLACGALAPAGALRKINTRIVCIMGYEDFNFPELADFILNPQNVPDNLNIELTNDPHRWPSEEMLYSAMEFLVQASDQQMEYRIFPEISGYISSQKQRIEQYICDKDFIRAVMCTGSMAKIPAFDKDGHFRDRLLRLQQEKTYQEQTALLSQSLLFEEKKRREYTNTLFYKPVVWWEQEQESWNEEIRKEEDDFMLMAHSRLKSWLMEACQSVYSRYEKEKDPEKLERIRCISRLII